MRGAFIVIEGADGAGKTVQARQLVSRYAAARVAALYECEPTRDDGPGAVLRAILRREEPDPGPRATALLFVADRARHLARTIEPALAAGVTVVCDRFSLSTIAYQHVAHGLDIAWLASLHDGLRVPDLTIILDVPATTAAKRRGARNQAAELFEGAETQHRIARFYRDWPSSGLGVVKHVDGEGDVDDVAARVWNACAVLDARITARAPVR